MSEPFGPAGPAEQLPPVLPAVPAEEDAGQAVGTGIVLTSRGRLLTNSHVVAGATIVPTAFLGVQITASGFAGPPQRGARSSTTDGALVAGVLPDTAAAQAGPAAGDLVTAVDDQPIDSSAAMAARHPGDTVSLHWIDQEGQAHTATGTLTAGPAA